MPMGPMLVPMSLLNRIISLDAVKYFKVEQSITSMYIRLATFARKCFPNDSEYSIRLNSSAFKPDGPPDPSDFLPLSIGLPHQSPQKA